MKRAEIDVRVGVAGKISQEEWGAPTAVLVSAGNRSETIDAAELVEQKPGRLSFKGGEVVRSLKVDFSRASYRSLSLS